jgi:acetyl-CoA carboxylase carboxyl transferase subunit beta
VNRLGWPGYVPRSALRWGTGTVTGHPVVVAVWDFDVFGGSFGEREASGLVEAAAAAAAARVPLVTFLRSGGTRLQEGVAGLVGLPRATLALGRLARAQVPHVAVADHPTTGGVWVTVGSRADLRCAVAGATVGFAGPRVVEATTGAALPPGSHTARAAYDAGLVDALLDPGGVAGWLGAALTAVAAGPGVQATRRTGSPALPTAEPDAAEPDAAEPDAAEPDAGPRSPRAWTGPRRGGWEQVLAARTLPRPAAGRVLADLLAGGVAMRGPDGSVAARAGRLADRGGRPGARVVGVAVAAERATHPSPDGYRLLTRAARLAGRLGLPLVTLVDTPGADPGPTAERAGIAPAIGEAMEAVLGCPSPTLAIVLGEGGSGGALAAACADTVMIAPGAYVTALSPEGAAVTLGISPRAAADAAGLLPGDLLALGLADAPAPDPADPAFPAVVAAAIASLVDHDAVGRLRARETRWSAPLTGCL